MIPKNCEHIHTTRKLIATQRWYDWHIENEDDTAIQLTETYVITCSDCGKKWHDQQRYIQKRKDKPF